MTMFDEEERYRINAFDWDAEFPAIMKSGGFDVVIGNPPYIRSQSLGKPQKDYYARKYSSATRTYDIYVLFVEKAMSLLRRKGRTGFILPNKFFTTDYGEGLRALLAKRQLLDRLVDFEDAQVFAKGGTYTTLMFLCAGGSLDVSYAKLGDVFREKGAVGLSSALRLGDIHFDSLSVPGDGSRWTLAVGTTGELLSRLEGVHPPLTALEPHIFQGLKTSADKVYMLQIIRTKASRSLVRNKSGEESWVETAILKPFVKGEHVRRYRTDTSGRLCILYPYTVGADGRAHVLDEDQIADCYPSAYEYLLRNRAVLGSRDRGKWSKRKDWYAYARSQNLTAFFGSKYLVPYMTTRLRADYDTDKDLFFVNITTGGYGLTCETDTHPYYLLGLLNSKLLDLCVRQLTNRFRGGYFAVNKQALSRLPIRLIDPAIADDSARHDKLVELVERMLSLHKQLAAAKTAHDKTVLQRQIDATDRQIDQLVYELYGLTDDEIKIVEEAAAR